MAQGFRSRLLEAARSGAFGADLERQANLVTGQGFKLRNITNDAGTTVTELFLYDVIGGWFGIEASDVVRELMAITTDQINVRINSPGGDVFDGIAIMNSLISHPATVNVTVDSLCASIATAIAMAGETVTMMPGSQMMIHNASGLCWGEAKDMRKLADILDFQTRNIASLYARRAGGEVDAWLAAMDEETWLSDEEAVSQGLADQVAVIKQGDTQAVPGADPADEDWDAWDLTGFKFAGRAEAPAPAIAKHDAPVLKSVPALINTTVTLTEDDKAAIAAITDESPAVTDPFSAHFLNEQQADDVIRRTMKEALV